MSVRARLGRILQAASFCLRYGSDVRRLGLFNREHYAHQADNLWARLMPLAHYLLVGWRKGISPLPELSTKRLLELFPHSQGVQDLSPLEIYVQFARFAGGSFSDVSSVQLSPIVWPETTTEAVIVIHAFYLEEFEFILGNLTRNLDEDLIITSPYEAPSIEQLLAKNKLRAALVVRTPNRGRDILPFVYLLNEGLLDRYRYIGKLHTKKSLHRRDGDLWFRKSVRALVGSGMAARAHARFSSEPTLGILTPAGMISNAYLDPSRWKLNALAARASLECVTDDLQFPAGSMFWARAEALKSVVRARIGLDEFEPEAGQLEGTLAHAVERFFGMSCIRGGFRLDELRPEKDTRD